MTRYEAWMTALINRDQTLVYLTLLAVSLVAAWCLTDYYNLPEKTNRWIKRGYMVGGAALWLLTLRVTVLG